MGHTQECPVCNGKGKVKRFLFTTKCSGCVGTGKIIVLDACDTEEEPQSLEVKLDTMTKLARSKILNDIEKGIRLAQKEGRLVFNVGGTTQYTDRNGVRGVYDEEQFAAKMWDVFDKKLGAVQAMGMTAGLGTLAIMPDDIKTIVNKIKGG